MTKQAEEKEFKDKIGPMVLLIIAVGLCAFARGCPAVNKNKKLQKNQTQEKVNLIQNIQNQSQNTH